MITLIFDALRGTPRRDNEVLALVEQTIAQAAQGDVTVSIANTIALDAFRVAVRENRIALESIQITVIDQNGETLAPKLYRDGGMEGWAPCMEVLEGLLMRLF